MVLCTPTTGLFPSGCSARVACGQVAYEVYVCVMGVWTLTRCDVCAVSTTTDPGVIVTLLLAPSGRGRLRFGAAYVGGGASKAAKRICSGALGGRRRAEWWLRT